MTMSSPSTSSPSSTKNKVAIVGYGFVGKGMHKIFPEAIIYSHNYDEKIKKQINEECGLAIVCVPTPPKGMEEQKVNPDESNFLEVDLSIIEETIAWLQTPLILIKSTIPPGTTSYLRNKYNKEGIAFSPEYMGEGKYYTPPQYPDPEDPRKHEFVIVGGYNGIVDQILVYFKEKLGPTKTYFKCTDVEAECVKYMENTWGATKVTFVNEWFEMCKSFGASFNTVREGFVLDSRVEKMHTTVFENKRGFGGKCYPKDLLGIIAHSESKGYEPKLLKQVWETNKYMLKQNEDKHQTN